MKINKTAIGLVVLSLMFAPLASFASKQEARTIKEPRTGTASTETTQGLMTPSVTSQQNQGEVQGVAPIITNQQNKGEIQQTNPVVASQQNKGEEQQVKQGSQIGQEDANGNDENGQLQKQVRDEEENQTSDKATQRRSRVANAVQEMIQVAERNGGVGEQIRTVAQAQNENQEKIEEEMEQVKNRGQLKKFFFGPDYKNLNSVEERLLNHDEKITELKELTSGISNVVDLEILEEQIRVMEEVKTELENEVTAESKGFSLFGWLNKMLVK